MYFPFSVIGSDECFEEGVNDDQLEVLAGPFNETQIFAMLPEGGMS